MNNISTIYEKYNITEKDIAYYIALFEQGEEERAIEEFNSTYLIPAVEDYNMVMLDFLYKSEDLTQTRTETAQNERNVSLLTYGLNTLLIKNFTILSKDIEAPFIYKKRSITNAEVKESISNATLGEFEANVTKATTSMQTDILNNMRKVRRDVVLFKNTSAKTLKGIELEKATALFQRQLKQKYPTFYKMKKGNFLNIADIGKKERYFKVETYINELVRTTILNIDRVAVQVSVQVKEAAKAKATNREAVNVVEYYTASHAPYKTSRRREICKTILADKSYGIPLLALDKKTSDLLGIMTVEQAMTTLEGAMGPHCHHGVRPIPVVKRKELEKIIRERR